MQSAKVMDRFSIFATLYKNECEKLTVKVRVFYCENDVSLDIFSDILNATLLHFVSIINLDLENRFDPW